MARIKLPKPVPEDWYDVARLIDLLGVSRRQIFYYFSRSENMLPHVQVNHKNYVKPQDLDLWLANETGKSLSEWIEKKGE